MQQPVLEDLELLELLTAPVGGDPPSEAGNQPPGA